VSLAGLIAAQRALYGRSARGVLPGAALGLSQAWFYQWAHGDVSLRRKRRAALAALIVYLFTEHHGSYGSPRIIADL